MKAEDIVCWQIKLEELFFSRVEPRYEFVRDWRYTINRKLTESLTPIAYWRIKKLNK